MLFSYKTAACRKENEMTVKIAGYEDFLKLRELYRLYSGHISRLLPEEFRENEQDELVFRFIVDEESTDVIFIENDENEACAMAQLRVCHTEPSAFRHNKTYLYLSEICLKDNIGCDLLLDAAIKWGADRGCEYVDIDLPSLHALGCELKEKYGFSEKYVSYSKPIPEELRSGAKERRFSNIEKMLLNKFII